MIELQKLLESYFIEMSNETCKVKRKELGYIYAEKIKNLVNFENGKEESKL